MKVFLQWIAFGSVLFVHQERPQHCNIREGYNNENWACSFQSSLRRSGTSCQVPLTVSFIRAGNPRSAVHISGHQARHQDANGSLKGQIHSDWSILVKCQICSFSIHNKLKIAVFQCDHKSNKSSVVWFVLHVYVFIKLINKYCMLTLVKNTVSSSQVTISASKAKLTMSLLI